MRFSVVIPSHNSENWIKESVQSVLSQTLPPSQIILIDDSSTDHTVREIEKFTGLGPLEFYSVRYGNAAQTRNECLKYVKGDWIAFLDADDVWYPHHLENARDLLEKDPSVAGYINHYDHYSLDSRIMKRKCDWGYRSSMHGLNDRDYLVLYEKFNCFVGMSACIVAADRFREIGGFDVSLKRRHDIDMWLRLINKNKWSVDLVSGSAYRENVPGNISHSLVDRDLYKLRGLLKNKDSYGDHAGIYSKIVRNTALAALNKSVLYGDAAFRREVMAFSKQEIDFFFRIFFRAGFLFSGPYRLSYKLLKYVQQVKIRAYKGYRIHETHKKKALRFLEKS